MDTRKQMGYIDINIVMAEHTGMRIWSNKALAAAAERERDRMRRSGITVENDRGRADFNPIPNPLRSRSSYRCWDQFESWAGIRFGHAIKKCCPNKL